MKSKTGHVTFKIILLIIATDVLEAISQLLFKSGVLASGFEDVYPANALQFIAAAAVHPQPYLAILLHILNFCIWMIVLSRVDLSVAYPIGSTSYIFVTLLSILFLHENVSLLRWTGVFIIVSGIFFISRSAKTEEGT